MKLIVNAHNIELIKEETVNEKEINISKCTFEFSEEYGDNLVKEAYFTLEGETYKQLIINNECSYPPEVLVKTGTVELGVVAYEIAGSEYIERYNPSPVYFQTVIGSLKDHAENSEEITPSEMEQFEQALEEGLAEVANVDIDATKVDNTATVSITNRNGETKTVEIYDGEKGEDGEPGITPNIQVGNTTTLPAGSNATVSQRGTTENPIFDFGIPKGEDGSAGTLNYADLTNKPSINNVTLNGNKTTSDLGIVIPDVSNYITKDVNNLTYYTLATGTGSTIELSINSSTYVMTLNLKNSAGTTISTGTVDLPLESVVVNGSYDSTNKKIILTLQSGSTIDVPVGDLVSGLQTQITSSNKLSSDLVDDTNNTNLFVTSSDKSTWSGKQDALVSGTNIKTINNESILGSGNVSISGGQTIQYNTVPTASVDNLGQIIQYTGTTDSTYTNGYFYKCVNNGGTYSWENTNVQASGGGQTPTVIESGSTSSATITAMNGWLAKCDFSNRQLAELYTYTDSYPNIRYRLISTSTYNITSSTTGNAYLYFSCLKIGTNTTNSRLYTRALRITLTSGVITSLQWRDTSEDKVLLTASNGATITGQFSFSTVLPQSSLVPTSNDHLVNKKYVDDQVGAINTVLATLTTPSNGGN